MKWIIKFTFLFIFLLSFYFFDCTKFLSKAVMKDPDLPDKPILLNVTYTTPLRDLDEERKYSYEHLNYMRKVRRLEEKFTGDIDLLKMIMNVQNTQIEKLNEIVMVNHEIAKEVMTAVKG